MTTDVDVVVIGVGSVGSMALWKLATLTGLRVLGVDQYGVGHAHGSYAGESRVFRSASHEGRRYIPLLLRSRELWLELQEESGRELLLETGTLSIGESSERRLQRVLEAVSEFQLPHEVLGTDELRHRYPQHRLAGEPVGVLDRLGGGLRPEASVLAAVELARRAGADILTNDRVTRVDEEGERYVISTESGRQIRTERVVATTGSWSTDLFPELREQITVTPVALTWFAPQDVSRYRPDNFPVFLRDQEGVHMFGVPSLDGYSVKLVTHNTDESIPLSSVADLPARLSRNAIREISEHAACMLDGISPEPVRHSLHHEGWTMDRVPIIRQDNDERMIVVAGLSGHGFKFCSGLGEWIATRIGQTAGALERDMPLIKPSPFGDVPTDEET